MAIKTVKICDICGDEFAVEPNSTNRVDVIIIVTPDVRKYARDFCPSCHTKVGKALEDLTENFAHFQIHDEDTY